MRFRVDIKGYKSIQDQKIKLVPINILIGSNGVGKSNFISIFSLVRNLYEQNLQNYVLQKGGADSFLYFGKKETKEIYFDFYFGNKSANNRFVVTLSEAQNSLYIKELKTAFLPQSNWHYTTYETAKQESSFININRGQAYWVNDRLREFEVYHFHDTGPAPL